MHKPAIPSVPKPGEPRARFDQALKEIMELITARRADKIKDLANTGERWKDITSTIVINPAGGAGTVPTWSVFREGLRTWAFSAADPNECWANYHIPHDFKIGTKAYPHIHWAVTGVNTGVVRWGIEYTLSKGFSQQAFPASIIVYVEQAATGTAYTHLIAEVADADSVFGDFLEPDTIISARIFRDGAHANDTQTAPAFVFSVDLHFQSDGADTTTKAPLWAKNTSEPGQDTLDKVNEILERLQ